MLNLGDYYLKHNDFWSGSKNVFRIDKWWWQLIHNHHTSFNGVNGQTDKPMYIISEVFCFIGSSKKKKNLRNLTLKMIPHDS